MACVGALRTFGAPAPLTLVVRPLFINTLEFSKRIFMALANPISARSGAHFQSATQPFTPIGARHRSGSGNAITEPGHHPACQNQAFKPQNTTRALSLDSSIICRQPNSAVKRTPTRAMAYAIFLALVGTLQSLRSFRRRLPRRYASHLRQRRLVHVSMHLTDRT